MLDENVMNEINKEVYAELLENLNTSGVNFEFLEGFKAGIFAYHKFVKEKTEEKIFQAMDELSKEVR